MRALSGSSFEYFGAMASGNTASMSPNPHSSRRKSFHLRPFSLPEIFRPTYLIEHAGTASTDFNVLGFGAASGVATVAGWAASGLAVSGLAVTGDDWACAAFEAGAVAGAAAWATTSAAPPACAGGAIWNNTTSAAKAATFR